MTRLIARFLQGSIVLSALAVTAPAAASDWGCTYSAERRASIDATGAKRVVVIARAGDLEMRPASGTVVQAAGQACTSREDYLRETQLAARRDGDVIYVEALLPGEMQGFGKSYASLDLTVEVPGGLPVDIDDTSGDVEAHDVRVEKVTDSSGDIELRGISGDVAIIDTSGDVSVAKVTGRVQVQDSSGDIVIDGAGEVVIPSDSSGDITVEHIAGDVRIEHDSSGDIRIRDVGGNVQLLSDTSGEVKVSHVKGTVQLP